MITFVLVTRNDGHEGDSTYRLAHALYTNYHRLKKAFPNSYKTFQILVGDWGSDVPLSFEVLGIEDIPIVKFVHFPKEITSLFDSEFNEAHPLNYLIRNAGNNVVARLDQDIILGNVFLNYLRRQSWGYLSNSILWSSRTDMQRSGNEVYSLPQYSPTFYMDAIGIIMAPWQVWASVKGYNEAMIYRNHMEHDLYKRFVELVGVNRVINIGDELCNPFFHIWHPKTATEDRRNNDPNTPFANTDDWGLEQYKHLITIK